MWDSSPTTVWDWQSPLTMDSYHLAVDPVNCKWHLNSCITHGLGRYGNSRITHERRRYHYSRIMHGSMALSQALARHSSHQFNYKLTITQMKQMNLMKRRTQSSSSSFKNTYTYAFSKPNLLKLWYLKYRI
jgi:hypothetical protein